MPLLWIFLELAIALRLRNPIRQYGGDQLRREDEANDIEARIMGTHVLPRSQAQINQTHFKVALKFSLWISGLAYGALYNILSGRLGGNINSNKILFRLCTTSLVATIVCGASMMLIIYIRQYIRYALVVVNVMLVITSAIALASVTLCYALLQK